MFADGANPSNLWGLASLVGMLGGESNLNNFVESSPILSHVSSFIGSWLQIDVATWTIAFAVLGTFPSALTQLRSAAFSLSWWVAKHFMASVSVSGNDRLNKEIINWVSNTVLPWRAVRMLSARTETVSDNLNYYRREIQERNDVRHEKRVPIEYLPAYGTTWFFHDWNVFLVRRMPDPHSRMADVGFVPVEYASAPEGVEPLVVMCLGRSAEPIKRFFETCRDFADNQHKSYVTVRSSDKADYPTDHCWGSVVLRPVRPLETVHFDETIKMQLVKDITYYLNPATRKFYNTRGIPYRRGYLLHGPPGTGKTSLSIALAGLFDLDLYLCHIPSIKSDVELEKQFATLPPKCIVLLEDIDAVGIDRRRSEDDDDSDDDDDDPYSRKRQRRYNGYPGCSLAGLLNILDGVSSQEGRIVLMTSNFAHKLDRALVRPGRIDKMIFLGNISQRSAESMFLRMYTPDTEGHTGELDVEINGDELQKLSIEFAARVPNEVFTPAQLQGCLLNYRQDPHAAVREISTWVEEEKKALAEIEALAKKDAERRARRRRAKNTHIKIDLGNMPNNAPQTEGQAKEAGQVNGVVEGETSGEGAKESESPKVCNGSPATNGVNGNGCAVNGDHV